MLVSEKEKGKETNLLKRIDLKNFILARGNKIKLLTKLVLMRLPSPEIMSVLNCLIPFSS